MKYMGSKSRHAREIIPIILEGHKPEAFYVEPFVGGCNVIDSVYVANRIGCDINPYLIALWKAVASGWMPPASFSEGSYADVRDNKDKYPPELVGYVGFALSYAGKWFGGWCRDSAGKRDYVNEAYKNAIKQFPKLLGARFECCSYSDIDLPENCTIYCDPPYKDTTKYKDTFSHVVFYDWCRSVAKNGHTVFVSEYNMPDDFECVWEKSVKSSLTKDTGQKSATERLFTLGRQYE